MRSPVYRNLDRPFQILGFNVLELTVLCIVFVGGGEIADFFGVTRLWPFLFTLILGLGIFWTRHSLGDYFVKRLFRFWKLPRFLHSRILVLRRYL